MRKTYIPLYITPSEAGSALRAWLNYSQNKHQENLNKAAEKLLALMSKMLKPACKKFQLIANDHGSLAGECAQAVIAFLTEREEKLDLAGKSPDQGLTKFIYYLKTTSRFVIQRHLNKEAKQRKRYTPWPEHLDVPDTQDVRSTAALEVLVRLLDEAERTRALRKADLETARCVWLQGMKAVEVARAMKVQPSCISQRLQRARNYITRKVSKSQILHEM